MEKPFVAIYPGSPFTITVVGPNKGMLKFCQNGSNKGFFVKCHENYIFRFVPQKTNLL